ncbi:MAG: YlmH/Sll1252 family protein [Butyrivibrio sp.]|nr:YlmH/Sll1252 family protein [Butyrivibrio sp.]
MKDKSADYIYNHLVEQAAMCYNRGISVATDFLDLNGQSIFHTAVKDMPPVVRKEMGGYDLAERKLILFLPYEDFPYSVPYDIIKISPSAPRFAEELGHRDFLGALMSLGIVREKLGDIITDGSLAYVFCVKSVTDYIVSNLSQIRHTFVKAEAVSDKGFSYEPRFESIRGSVASLRLDALISLGFGHSRSRIIQYIEAGKTAVNGKIITSNACVLKEGDIISVRGLGRLKFERAVSETRKGRIMVILRKYI